MIFRDTVITFRIGTIQFLNHDVVKYFLFHENYGLSYSHRELPINAFIFINQVFSIANVNDVLEHAYAAVEHACAVLERT